jgi:hypothetical protein
MAMTTMTTGSASALFLTREGAEISEIGVGKVFEVA